MANASATYILQINTAFNEASIGIGLNGLLFISGQIAMDPSTGNIDTSNIEGETHQVMKNLAAILAAAGLDFSAVVKTTIFLTDMSLFTAVNGIYAGYFTGDYPARETVAVKGLPKAVNVEISMIAAG